MVSRTLDFRLDAAMGGLAAAAAGDALSTGRPRVWLLVLAALLLLVSLASNRLGKEMGLGIRDLVSDVFRMPTTPLVLTLLLAPMPPGVPPPPAEQLEQLV